MCPVYNSGMIMGFSYFSYDGMIDVVRRVGLRFACTRLRFNFELKVRSSRHD